MSISKHKDRWVRRSNLFFTHWPWKWEDLARNPNVKIFRSSSRAAVGCLPEEKAAAVQKVFDLVRALWLIGHADHGANPDCIGLGGGNNAPEDAKFLKGTLEGEDLKRLLARNRVIEIKAFSVRDDKGCKLFGVVAERQKALNGHANLAKRLDMLTGVLKGVCGVFLGRYIGNARR